MHRKNMQRMQGAPIPSHYARAPTAGERRELQRRVKHVNPTLYSSPQATAFRGITIREARHNVRLSNWPEHGGPASSTVLKIRTPQLRQDYPEAFAPAQTAMTAATLYNSQHALARESIDGLGRPASAQVRVSAESLPQLGRGGIPRPSSAPGSHVGISPRMQSELRNLVY